MGLTLQTVGLSVDPLATSSVDLSVRRVLAAQAGQMHVRLALSAAKPLHGLYTAEMLASRPDSPYRKISSFPDHAEVKTAAVEVCVHVPPSEPVASTDILLLAADPAQDTPLLAPACVQDTPPLAAACVQDTPLLAPDCGLDISLHPTN